MERGGQRAAGQRPVGSMRSILARQDNVARGRGLAGRRLVGRKVGRGEPCNLFPPAQLELFPENRKRTEKRTNLVAAIDTIRDRFGNSAINMGRVLAA